MVYENYYAFALGAWLAWVTWYPARKLEPKLEQRYFTVILIATAVGFIGFPLWDESTAGIVTESIALLGTLVLLLLGRFRAPQFLAIAFLAHAGWDVVSMIGLLPVDKPDWLMRIGIVYDVLIGLYLLRRTAAWGSAEVRPLRDPEPPEAA